MADLRDMRRRVDEELVIVVAVERSQGFRRWVRLVTAAAAAVLVTIVNLESLALRAVVGVIRLGCAGVVIIFELGPLSASGEFAFLIVAIVGLRTPLLFLELGLRGEDLLFLVFALVLAVRWSPGDLFVLLVRPLFRFELTLLSSVPPPPAPRPPIAQSDQNNRIARHARTRLRGQDGFLRELSGGKGWQGVGVVV